MRHAHTHTHRGRETGRGRSRLHAGSLTWDSIPGLQIMPWAEGRCLTAEPLRDPLKTIFGGRIKRAW